MRRRSFTKFVIGVSLAIMTGAYNIENPIKEDTKQLGRIKGKDLIWYHNGKLIEKQVTFSLPIHKNPIKANVRDIIQAT